eukprot:12835732-Alexandrium_andersonii.AAC.1
MSGMIKEVGYPLKGIVAALPELRGLTPVMSAASNEQTVLSDLVSAGDSVVSVVEEDLGCEVALHKSQLTASSQPLLE